MSFPKSMTTVGAIAAALVLMVSVSQARQFHVPAVENAAKADVSETQAILNRLEVADATLDEGMAPSEIAKAFHIPTSVSFLRSHAHVTYTDRLTIIVNKAQKGTSPTAQQMNVYLDGQLIHTFPVSTGREKPEVAKSGLQYFSTTPVGKFRIEWRAKNWYSQQWLAPMPYAQFFSGGTAIHATIPAHFKALGRRDSGGCVRLHPDNAKIMWDLVDQVGVNNVLIEIVNQPY